VINYGPEGEGYLPDFVAETESAKLLCETKRASELSDPDVRAKAREAALWCERASQHDRKPWSYLLVPHDAVLGNMTIAGLASSYVFSETPANHRVAKS